MSNTPLDSIQSQLIHDARVDVAEVKERVEKAIPVGGFTENKPVPKYITYLSTIFFITGLVGMYATEDNIQFLPESWQTYARLLAGISLAVRLGTKDICDFLDDGKLNGSYGK